MGNDSPVIHPCPVWTLRVVQNSHSNWLIEWTGFRLTSRSWLPHIPLEENLSTWPCLLPGPINSVVRASFEPSTRIKGHKSYLSSPKSNRHPSDKSEFPTNSCDSTAALTLILKISRQWNKTWYISEGYAEKPREELHLYTGNWDTNNTRDYDIRR